MPKDAKNLTKTTPKILTSQADKRTPIQKKIKSSKKKPVKIKGDKKNISQISGDGQEK